jgi:hypothetical protein
MALWAAGQGQEVHGVGANPLFTDPANGDFSLQVGSPCIEAGVIITGFNDVGDPFEYMGAAPDIGAVEYDSGAPLSYAPVLTPIGNMSVYAGQPLQFDISATDADGDSLTYSASNLPQGASFDSATRTFSWTPAAGQVGSYPDILFEVSDGQLTDSENIIIIVNNVNSPPVLNSIGNKSVIEGVLLEFNVSASDPDGDSLTYSASNLP